MTWVLLILLLGAVVVITALIAKLKSKELKETQDTLEKQKEVVKEYNEISDEATQIQSKAKEQEADLVNAVKGVQSSEKPIEKSINLGNDIVDSFNK